MNPIQSLPPYFFKIHLNIILSLRFSKWPPPFRPPTKDLCIFLHIPCVLHAPPIFSLTSWS
jgi:hypothetical protein